MKPSVFRRFLATVLATGMGAGAIGYHKQVADMDAPETQVKLIQGLQPQIKKKLAAVHSDDDTDLSPVTIKLAQLNDKVTDDDIVGDLNHRFYTGWPSDGLIQRRYVLAHNVKDIVKLTNADEDPKILDLRRQALVNLLTELDGLASKQSARVPVSEPGH